MARPRTDYDSPSAVRALDAPAAYGLLLTAILLSTLLFVLWRDHQSKIDDARRQVGALAMGSDRLLTLQMRNLERTLAGIAAESEQLTEAGSAQSLRAEIGAVLARQQGELSELLIVDQAGRPLTEGTGDPTIANWATAATSQQSTKALILGSPVRATSGTSWLLPIAMALPAGDGPRGWVLARMPLSTLSTIAEGLDVGTKGAVNIFHRNGTLLARAPAAADKVGQDFSHSEVMRELLPRSRSGISDRVSPLDKVRRIIAYRALDRYPLVVVVGVARDEVLAPWFAFASVAALVCVAYALGWLLLVRTLLRVNQRQRGLLANLAINSEQLLEAQHEAQRDIAELALAHDRLRDTEAQYRLLFEQNPLPFWVFHRESFCILEANEAAVEQYGYSREEFRGMTIADVRPAEDVAEALEIARLGRPETRRGRIWRHVRKNGEIFSVAVHSSDITFRGQPARLVLALDVTERQRDQRRLELSESRFQLVARATSDAVFDWNIVSGESWRSDSFNSLFRYQADQMPDTIDAWRERVHPDDRSRVEAGLHAVFHESDALEWRATYRFRRGDGSYAHVLDRGMLERDAEGKPSRMVGGMVDISRQYHDEAELRLLRRAIESTENGVSIVDARAEDMPLVYINPSFERITGYSESEALGRNCRFLQGTDQAQDALETVRAALAAEHESHSLLRNYRKDGQLFYNQLSLSPVRDEAGTLTHFVGIVNDVTERQQHEGQLAYQASHDALTGVLNRGALLAALEQLLVNGEAAVSLLYLDINNFKLINDSLGHEVGDEVLRVIAQRLRAVVGGVDRIGRLGGNEFLILLGPEGLPTADVVERILLSLVQPIEALATLHYLSLHAGIARYPEHGRTPEILFKNAGLATHEAKRRGHNQLVEYTPAFERSVTDRQQLVSRLHEAMERGEFELFFQPLFSAAARRPIGLEALIRWRHPERGLVPPVEFIPVCEDSGLIVPLGRWVLREACRYHHLLAAAGWPDLTIAVNVSAMQFLSGELQHDVPSLLREFQMPPGILELELTESLVMENPESVIEVMRELRQHGVLLSIDDFGTGYSSMSYLHRLPVDKLKIDRSFVTNVETDGHNAAICESILALARSFELKVIAEGVETQAQLDWLRAHGCDEVQGYLLARPQPFAEMVAGLGRVDAAPA